jgi:hypothetical protein
MSDRNVLVVLAVALCATLASGSDFRAVGEPGWGRGGPLSTLDVDVQIVSPQPTEPQGIVPIVVLLNNVGDVAALVPRLDVTCHPSGYSDYLTSISIAVGMNYMAILTPWNYGGATETCMAWITYPADTNHSNDTDIVIVTRAGIEDRAEMGPGVGMSLTLSPNPLAGNVLRVEYSLNQAGPASVTLFDVSGRPVAKRDFVGTRTGELALDLSWLSGGVYLMRLDDGHQRVVQKLVVQR